MSRGRACAYMLMVGGMLLFAGGASQAEQSKSPKSGTQSGNTTMGTGSGSTGGSSGTMKQGHESSGKMGQDSAPITEENPGGIIPRGGKGNIPSSSNVDPLSTDQRDNSTLGSKPNSGSRSGSSGSMGSSGGTGPSGGTGSSGGAGGY